jgi:hypothetical protein
MKNSFVRKIASALLISLGALGVSVPAQAATFINGWQYANDDQVYDGSNGSQYGRSSQYDFYGFGFKQVGQELYVGINTSYKLGGSSTPANTNNSSRVLAGVGYGDLFLDFGYNPNGGRSFNAAQGKANLLGVKFAPNDSTKTVNGVYTGVAGKSVAGTNQGYTNLNSYNNAVKADADNAAFANKNSNFGDLAWGNTYFGNNPANVINTGTLANNSVRSLSTADLAAQLFPTTVKIDAQYKNIFGFAFTLPEEFRGMSFLATLGFECSNDTISGYIPTRPVPVPPAIAGILVAGAIGGWRIKRKQQAKAKA